MTIPLGLYGAARPVASGGGPPEFVSVSSAAGTSATASVPVPAHEAGDVLLLWVNLVNAQASVPTGWTLLHQSETVTNIPAPLLAWRRATAAEPEAVSVTLSASVPYGAMMACYRGAADPAPGTVSQAATPTFGARSEVPVPAGGVSADGLWVVVSGMFSNVSGSYTDVPGGHTERLRDIGGARKVVVADAHLAGTPPATTIPVNSSTSCSTRTVRLPLVGL